MYKYISPLDATSYRPDPSKRRVAPCISNRLGSSSKVQSCTSALFKTTQNGTYRVKSKDVASSSQT